MGEIKQMARKNIDDQKIDVWNNSQGRVSYILDGKKYLWDKPGAKKQVKLSDLKDLVNISGGYTLLVEELLIKDVSIREELGLPVNEGQMLDSKGIAELLNKTSSEIDSVLNESNSGIIDKVAVEAVNLSITDTDKMDVIQKHSGVDVQSAIREKKEETQN